MAFQALSKKQTAACLSVTKPWHILTMDGQEIIMHGQSFHRKINFSKPKKAIGIGISLSRHHPPVGEPKLQLNGGVSPLLHSSFKRWPVTLGIDLIVGSRKLRHVSQ
jgi:hypothetical protein